MKVEFTAPEILKGESINSQLVVFFFSFPSGTEENVNEPRAVLKVLAGFLSLLAQIAASCLSGVRAARSALPRELG